MKKLIEAIKANRTLLIILAVVLLLIIIVVVFYDGGEDAASGQLSEKSRTETRLEEILSSIDGVGESSVMVTEDGEDIIGVVIVCQGADNIMTRSDILNVVSTALNIQKNIIAIYAMD